MNEVDLELALQEWGRAYGGSQAVQSITSSGVLSGGFGTNPIATAMQYGTKRDKSNAAAYKRPRAAVRAWRDPCAGKPTRTNFSALQFAGADIGVTSSLAQRVEVAAMELYRVDSVMGLVLRAQYCKRGTQSDKVAWINAQGRASALKLRTYRDNLALARAWMHGRLTA